MIAGNLKQTRRGRHAALSATTGRWAQPRATPDLGRLLQTEWTLANAVEEIFDPIGITDDQLRMMFSCCHPRLSAPAQVMLVLQLVAGFGAREVASAFVSSPGAVEKRLSRSKKTLAESGALFAPNFAAASL